MGITTEEQTQQMRKRSRHKVQTVPMLTQSSTVQTNGTDTASRPSRRPSTCSTNSKSPSKRKWKDKYEPAPLISQSTILTLGFFVFCLAMLWPPLILLFAYVVSKLVPYSFRENDDASTRRQLFAQFSMQDDLPEEFKNVPDHIRLVESYWVNSR